MKGSEIKAYLFFIFIIILLIIIILFLILKQINFQNDFKLSNDANKIQNLNVGEKKSVEIIVARYNEDLKWTLEYPFNQYKYIVYNKNSENENYEKSRVSQSYNIKNQGKCDHTYLYHITHHYNSLSEIIIFLPGCINESYFKYQKAKMLLEFIGTYHEAFFIVDYYSPEGIQNEFYYFQLDDYKSMTKSNLTMNEKTIFRKSKVRPFGKWFSQNFSEDIQNVSLFGIFSINRQDVLKYPKERYYKLMKSLEGAINDELSHYFEKSWEAVFYPLEYTMIVSYSNSFSTILMKLGSYYLKYNKGTYDIDLSSSPSSGPIFWNTIYFINKMTYFHISVK